MYIVCGTLKIRFIAYHKINITMKQSTTAGLTTEQVIQKVESGEISSSTYASITEYIKAMET